jgi:hypothetical protein
VKGGKEALKVSTPKADTNQAARSKAAPAKTPQNAPRSRRSTKPETKSGK